MIGRKFDMRSELAKCYSELGTIKDTMSGPTWQGFRLLLTGWMDDLDASILDLSQKYEKNKIEILYKLAMRNSYAKQLLAMKTTTERKAEIEENINKYEAILGTAPQGQPD